MKAFPDNGHLSREQRQFNYPLNRARNVVEHSYGRLKGRWRCLLKRLDVTTCDVPELVAACCVLRNICEIHGDAFNEQWKDSVKKNLCYSQCNHYTTRSASNIRNAFMSHFADWIVHNISPAAATYLHTYMHYVHSIDVFGYVMLKLVFIMTSCVKLVAVISSKCLF